MQKSLVVLPCLLLLVACAGQAPQRNAKNNDAGYFADASQCFDSTMHKQQIQLNVGGNSYPSPSIVTPINIDLPSVPDADAYSHCMTDLGYVPPKVDARAYLQTSQTCLDQTRGAANYNEAYADCIRKGGIAVDLFDAKPSR